jgi:hypothetical protein
VVDVGGTRYSLHLIGNPDTRNFRTDGTGDVLRARHYGLYAAIAGWRPLILRVGTVVHVMPQPRRSRRR